MKFQIATFKTFIVPSDKPRSALTGEYTAMCRVFPWSEENPIWARGATPEEAKERLLVILQRHLDGSFRELEVSEVELEMSDPVPVSRG
jgi:hypothetical protein